jgi:ribonuclease P/MRP protein subunit RPP1
LIGNACSLVRATGGRNIIVSSDARVAMEVRGPHDVANLATFFGLNQADARHAISTNPRSAMLHAGILWKIGAHYF